MSLSGNVRDHAQIIREERELSGPSRTAGPVEVYYLGGGKSAYAPPWPPAAAVTAAPNTIVWNTAEPLAAPNAPPGATAWHRTEVPALPEGSRLSRAAWLGGRLYLTGGVGSGKQVHCWDPGAGEFASEDPDAGGDDIIQGAAGKRKRKLSDGGGAAPPAAGGWRPMAQMNDGRYAHATVVLNGSLYVLGGLAWLPILVDAVEESSSSVERYDPFTNKWEYVTPMTTARAGFAAVAIHGRIVVCGGATASARQKPRPKRRAGASWVAPEPLDFILGGRPPRNVDYGVLRSCESYNPDTKTWLAMDDMPTARAGAAAAVLDGRLWVTGGCSSAMVLNTVEVLRPWLGKWSSKTHMVTKRFYHALVGIGGVLHAIGGRGPGDGSIRREWAGTAYEEETTVEKYVPAPHAPITVSTPKFSDILKMWVFKVTATSSAGHIIWEKSHISDTEKKARDAAAVNAAVAAMPGQDAPGRWDRLARGYWLPWLSNGQSVEKLRESPIWAVLETPPPATISSPNTPNTRARVQLRFQCLHDRRL